ncbi:MULTISPECIES: helix-turn-helix domain-containing protein [Salipiger]|uniref:helix-turn-helix domain-containing protein n=1 Tax=Salipiger TaxID=263377 RepID=UPI0035147AB7
MSTGLARKIQDERKRRDWSLTELAERAGVSRAMIHRIEADESSPTAAVIGRLAGAFGMTMSEMLAEPVTGGSRLSRAQDREVWQDPETGYVREVLTPRAEPGRRKLEIVKVTLPAGARVSFPPQSFGFLMESIWVQSGQLTFEEGKEVWRLGPDDCLTLGAPRRCSFVNESDAPCSYAVVVARI